ncbi:MAG: phosphoribosylformylglycinamidine synthase subunit PurL [Chthoniobacteraceae bacterium]|nr:phosphoribosylformylglycinamidine synthase subunit PurL [Chthoniobacteraceae bacterium]
MNTTAVSLPPDPEITPAVIAKHGITPDEYALIQKILGRKPNFTELGIFSVMWSEHCSYKNSKPELKKFPTTGPTVLVKAGEENAGVIDVGDGWAIAFKMESHNHPSAIEPFQGAATGVGGIIRDIFTMGARPVFNLNSLRFGSITGDSASAKTNRRLFSGVVAGIAHYGNCIGIPTIGGEVYFDDSYEGNPLVNVLCLGVLKHEEIARGAAKGIGNPVFYVGAETGRDGLAGAAFASRELTEESKQDRPAVQVGDPFKEKLLLEACLELLTTDAVAGIQDMGAAGLTCSTCETASRGNTGVEIDLEKVPKREVGMTPYEIMLSESQERMLIIVEKGKEDIVRRIFEKWDLPYAEVGTVKDDGMMRVKVGEVTVAEIPARQLADEAPIYHRETQAKPAPAPLCEIPKTDVSLALGKLLADPSIASKEWVYRQYDHMVRDGTMVLPGSDAAVFIVREANKILASTSDCNAIYCLLDPREGARLAVAEAARNLACSGAIPLAVTDNLNFGNPHKPENFWQLRECVEGIAEGCAAFNTPVTGGNVSLYNENPAGAIDPTPTIAMVGIIKDESHVTTSSFKNAGDTVILLGELGDEMGGSHYLKVLFGRKEGIPPRINFERERALHNTLRGLIGRGLLASAHDCAEGGLAVTLAESCFCGTQTIGAEIDFGTTGLAPEVLLFNESQTRVVVSAKPEDAEAVLVFAHEKGIPARRIGTVGGAQLGLKADGAETRWNVADLQSTWRGSIAACMA